MRQIIIQAVAWVVCSYFHNGFEVVRAKLVAEPAQGSPVEEAEN